LFGHLVLCYSHSIDTATSEENSMNRTAKALARKVAEGTATTREAQDFKATALILGWEGHIGRGVVNHISGESFRSWAALASSMLDNGVAGNGTLQPGSTPAPVAESDWDAAKERETAAIQESVAMGAADWSPTMGQAVKLSAVLDPRDESSDGELALVYWYTTRVPTVRLSNLTSVDVALSEESHGYVEATCEIKGEGCEGYGFLRVLPSSMLPGAERVQAVQCITCHEAAAEEYVRKLHGIGQ
jgi:hypothetical protein